MRSECSAVGMRVGGNDSVSPCAWLWVLMVLVAVGLSLPAFSLCSQAPQQDGVVERKGWYGRYGERQGRGQCSGQERLHRSQYLYPFPLFGTTVVYTPSYSLLDHLVMSRGKRFLSPLVGSSSCLSYLGK